MFLFKRFICAKQILNQVTHAPFMFQSESSKSKMLALGENIHECTEVLLQCEEFNEILFTIEI